MPKSKLLVLNVNGLLCSLQCLQLLPWTYKRWSPSKEEFQKYVRVVVRPGLKEFISLISQDFYVAIWSCMDDWILGRLLDILFPPRVYKSFNSRGVVPDVLTLMPSSPKTSLTSLKNTKNCKMPAPQNLFSRKIKSYSLMTCPVSVFEILLFQGIIPSLGVALTLLASSITSQKPFIRTSII